MSWQEVFEWLFEWEWTKLPKTWCRTVALFFLYYAYFHSLQVCLCMFCFCLRVIFQRVFNNNSVIYYRYHFLSTGIMALRSWLLWWCLKEAKWRLGSNCWNADLKHCWPCFKSAFQSEDFIILNILKGEEREFSWDIGPVCFDFF